MSVCPAVPDPPRNLQLSCDHGEDGKVEVSWSPPDKGHGLIREYIVSSFSSACRAASNPPRASHHSGSTLHHRAHSTFLCCVALIAPLLNQLDGVFQ